MNKDLYILTGNNKFFGQARKPWVSIDYDEMESILKNYGFNIHQCEYHEVINKSIEIKDSLVFYSFSQRAEIRRYLQDILNYLSQFNNTFIPNLELLKCHENKGYQELYKRKLDIESLDSFYFSNFNDLKHYNFDYPIVLKTVEGSNGKGVFLINSKSDLVNKIRKIEKVGLFESIDLIRRKYFRKNKTYKEYPKYNNKDDYLQYREYLAKNKRFILQKYVPNLMWDYRILVIFDRYYITKRHVGDDGFRASGAKRPDFDFMPDDKILNYAKQLYIKFDTPYFSIDIAYDEMNCYLLEFQALHFGPNWFLKTSGFYTHKNNNWNFNKKKPSIENDLAYGLISYINNKV